jgi:osmoprotectant transport system substrate-binding protein
LIAIAAGSPAFAQAVVVGGKNFTEQLLMAEITARLLRAKGFRVITRTGFATNGVRTEQELGLVDIYWEYTGTSLTAFNNVAEKLGPHEAYRKVKDLDARKGLVWLLPSKINNTYALAMRRADALERGIASISDLAAKTRNGETFRFLSNTEFYFRSDGLMPLQRAYRFEFGPENVVRMDTDAVYEVLRNSPAFDVGLVFSTDGRVSAFGFAVLRDDRGFFPSYILAPVVRKKVLDLHPELATHLNELSAKLDDRVMAGLNARVDIEKRSLEEVAAGFLQSSGLL